MPHSLLSKDHDAFLGPGKIWGQWGICPYSISIGRGSFHSGSVSVFNLKSDSLVASLMWLHRSVCRSSVVLAGTTGTHTLGHLKQ